jgi:hypothetical protein
MAEILKGGVMMPADWWIDLILIVMLSVIIAQNMGLSERLKKIAAGLDHRE